MVIRKNAEPNLKQPLHGWRRRAGLGGSGIIIRSNPADTNSTEGGETEGARGGDERIADTAGATKAFATAAEPLGLVR